MKALGMIETYGLIGAIEAADVMLKVADVSLMKAEKVRGGLVNVYVTGDVGAVKTAVDAGTSAVKRLGEASFYSAHVIPRPDNQVVSLYEKEESPLEEKPKKSLESLTELADFEQETAPEILAEQAKAEEELLVEEEPVVAVTPEPLQRLEVTAETDRAVVEVEETSEESAHLAAEPKEIILTSKEYKKQLEKTKVVDLRKLILNHQNLTLTEDAVQGMVKRKMIAILMEEFEKRGER